MGDARARNPAIRPRPNTAGAAELSRTGARPRPAGHQPARHHRRSGRPPAPLAIAVAVGHASAVGAMCGGGRAHVGEEIVGGDQAITGLRWVRSSTSASWVGTRAPSGPSRSEDSSYQLTGARVPQNERARASVTDQRNGTWSGSPV